MAEALQEAYEDIFLISARPSASDKSSFQGKFKSFHNASDNVASMMTNTFLKLVELADFDALDPTQQNNDRLEEDPLDSSSGGHAPSVERQSQVQSGFSGLHYNIQIHLPATKDLEVYNAIFKSLKEHLID